MKPTSKTEIPLKQWRAEEAIRLGICEATLMRRTFKAHTLPMPRLHRINKRVVNVVVEG